MCSQITAVHKTSYIYDTEPLTCSIINRMIADQSLPAKATIEYALFGFLVVFESKLYQG